MRKLIFWAKLFDEIFYQNVLMKFMVLIYLNIQTDNNFKKSENVYLNFKLYEMEFIYFYMIFKSHK